MLRCWNVNGNNITYDKDITWLINPLINQWIVSWFTVSTWSVASGKAILQATRTNWEVVYVSVENTTAITIDTTGTKKVYITIDQSKLDDWIENLENWTGIVSVSTWASYPSSNYIPLASITSGVITDERSFISYKWGKFTSDVEIIGRTTLHRLPPNSILVSQPKTELPIVNPWFSGTWSTTSWWINWSSASWWANNSWYWSQLLSFDNGRLKLETTWINSYVEARNTLWGYDGVTAQSLAVTPNTIYVLEYEYETQYISWDSSNWFGVYILMQQSDGVWAWTFTPLAWVKTTIGKTLFYWEFTTSATANYLNISPILYWHTWAWTLQMKAWVDNIKIYPKTSDAWFKYIAWKPWEVIWFDSSTWILQSMLPVPATNTGYFTDNNILSDANSAPWSWWYGATPATTNTPSSWYWKLLNIQENSNYWQQYCINDTWEYVRNKSWWSWWNWIPKPPLRAISKLTSNFVTSSTTFVDVTGSALALESGYTYRVQFDVAWSSTDATAQLYFSLSYGWTQSLFVYDVMIPLSWATNGRVDWGTGNDSLTWSLWYNSSVNTMITIFATIVTTSASNLTLRVKKTAWSWVNMTILAGTSWFAEKLSI